MLWRSVGKTRMRNIQMLFIWELSSQECFGVAGCPCWAHHGFAKEKEPLSLCKLTEERVSAVNGSVVTPACSGR